MVRDILKFIVSAEDAEDRACIFKRNNAQLVLFLLRKWEDTTGLRRPAREKARDAEEWAIRKSL